MSSRISPIDFASLGIASDAVAMNGLARLTDHGRYVVLRTPDNPHYWSGNKLILRDGAGADEVLDWFARAFPDALHVALEWDLPDLRPGRVQTDLAALGFKIQSSDVLTRDAPPPPVPAPDGIAIRTIAPRDWPQVEALQVETGLEGRFDETPYREFVAARMAGHRSQIKAGHAQWFGAFEGDLLAGDLGIVTAGELARYQSVETRSNYRGRGVASALLGAAADWAATRGARRFVIIADPETPAARLYRARGFDPAPTFLGALRPPPAGKSRAGME